jgi:hypothetical protein
MKDHESILERMELLGETTVRQQLASGTLDAEQRRDAEIWLGMKEIERKTLNEVAVSATLDQVRHARNANRLSLVALLLSLIAIAVSIASFALG